MKKRVTSLLITVLMICAAIPFVAVPVTAAETGTGTEFNEIMDPGTPYNFNNVNLQDPYGYGVGVPFLISEQNELFFMHNYNGSSSVKIGDTLKSKDSNTGRVMDSFDTVTDQTLNDAVKQLSFSKAVSFDPTGSGRKDHVAIVGINTNKDVNVFVYNAVTKTWSSGITLAKMSWVTDGSYYYQMGEFLSITAGDYDGDKKDTLVVYGAFDGTHGLFEVKVNDGGVLQKTSSSANNGMLNPAYNNVSGISGFLDADDEEGCDRMVCVLATGDINGDGIDDLATLSHGLGYRYGYDINYVLPYLSVTLGRTGASGILQSGLARTDEYIHEEAKYYDSDENTYTTFRAESMTFVNTDNRRGDEIVIAGNETVYYYYTGNNNYSYWDYGSGLSTAMYSWDNNGTVVRAYYTNQCREGDSVGAMSGNVFTDWGFGKVGRGTAQVAVQGVYMNGKGNYAYVLVGGDLYDYSDPVIPEKIYDFAYLNDADRGIGADLINVNYIPTAVAGNFDGNGEGFEQIVMVLGRKQNSFDDSYFSLAMIGIDHSKRDSQTSLPTDLSEAFYVTSNNAIETMDASDEGDDFDEALGFVIAAVDCDNDGVLARYSSKDYLYTDPSVLAVLQQAPVFTDLSAGNGMTTYSISESRSVSKGSSVGVSFGFSKSLRVSVGSFDLGVSAGYSLSWSKNFSESTSYSISESWTAQADDSVIVFRTPWFFYNYDIYNAETGKWEEDSFTVSIENAPSYQQISVDEYNRFVDYYNGKLSEKIDSFTPLTKINMRQCYVGLRGNPYLYPAFADSTCGSVQQLAYNGSATSISSSESTSLSESINMSHRISFSLDVGFGVEIGKIKVKEGIKASLDTTIGSSSSESHGNGVSVSGRVQGLDEKKLLAAGYTSEQIHAYGFGWKLGVWDSNLPTGENDKAGNPLYVPVVGYVVSNVTSLAHPVSGLTVEVKYDSINNPQGVSVSWDAPSTSDGFPIPEAYNVYLVTDGEYEKIATLAGSATEFMFADLQGRSSIGLAVRSVENTRESFDSGVRYCYIAYVGEKGERGPQGEKGEKGDPGVGIAGIALTSRDGNVDTYTVTLTDGTTYTYTVTNADKTIIYVNEIEEGDYIIYTALNDKMALDLLGGSGAKNAGDNLHLWTNGAAKVFTLTKDYATGSYKIQSKVSGLVLDVANASKENGANIAQWYDNGTDAQRWVFEPAGNGYYYIRCIGGQYMDVSGMVGGAQPYDGVNVQSWEFTGAANQKFRLLKVSSNATGSVLSDGNWWIIGGVAVLAVGGVAALVIVKKKQKSAAADGAEQKDEEQAEKE